MRQLSEDMRKKLQRLARKNGYDYAEFLMDWNGYMVFGLRFNTNKNRCIGNPQMILVNSNDEYRMTTFEEGMEINDMYSAIQRQ